MARQRTVPVALTDGYADGWPPATAIGRFLERVRVGNDVGVAALVAGLNPVDVDRWHAVGVGLLARYREDPGAIHWRRRMYSAFALAIAHAQAEAEAETVAVIREAALGDGRDAWRAAAWLLARTPKTTVEVDDEDDDDEISRLAAPVSAAVRNGSD